MKKRPDIFNAFVSFCAAYVAFVVALVFSWGTHEAGPMLRAAGVGMVFMLPALAAFVCMHCFEKLRPRYRVELPKLASFLTILLLVLSFVTGFVGQLVYSFRIQREETVVTLAGSNIVLMLDDSGSMVDYSDTVRSAAVAFVDSLSEECSLGAGLFAGKIGGFEDLQIMDSAGKDKIKALLDSANRFAGGTNINAALEQAYNCLSAAVIQNKQKAVILVTDGQSEVTQSIIDSYMADRILLYTIRISGSEGGSTGELLRFVENTGGFDTLITHNSASSINVDKLKEAFQNIAGTVDVRFRPDFEEGILFFYNYNVNIYRFVVQIVFLFILEILVQFLYFRKLSRGTLAACCGAALAGFAFELIVDAYFFMKTSGMTLAIYTSFAMLNIREEVNSDV